MDHRDEVENFSRTIAGVVGLNNTLHLVLGEPKVLVVSA
jgi:hypothetical protein